MEKAIVLGTLLVLIAASGAAWHGQPGVQGLEEAARTGVEQQDGSVQKPGTASETGRKGVSRAVLGIVSDGNRVPLCTVTMRIAGGEPAYTADCSIPATIAGDRFYVTMHANGMTVTG